MSERVVITMKDHEEVTLEAEEIDFGSDELVVRVQGRSDERWRMLGLFPVEATRSVIRDSTPSAPASG